ncbi:hypothetical protein IE53DRAFT_369887 [Violaceomyces palustris]|uniref:Uncharacterized protein n=1 Tax=Violaceomyces palustris TaxID=1673888 RepID=A0ACD0NU97_9BASI|nr:hypothetical protein IE53DRAFT_369887 [Violaceomyces palustris]
MTSNLNDPQELPLEPLESLEEPLAQSRFDVAQVRYISSYLPTVKKLPKGTNTLKLTKEQRNKSYGQHCSSRNQVKLHMHEQCPLVLAKDPVMVETHLKELKKAKLKASRLDFRDLLCLCYH